LPAFWIEPLHLGFQLCPPQQRGQALEQRLALGAALRKGPSPPRSLLSVRPGS
jgi:hypothetical protein